MFSIINSRRMGTPSTGRGTLLSAAVNSHVTLRIAQLRAVKDRAITFHDHLILSR
jgi:hypothetical protein